MKAFDCTDIQALLSGLVDGELDEAVRHEAERHLAGCATCRKLVSETERLNDLIRTDAEIPKVDASLPEGFVGSVLSRTVYADGLRFQGRRWATWTGWLAAAAAVMLALTVWIMDVQRRTVPTSIVAEVTESDTDSTPRIVTTTYRTEGKSWTFDGNLSRDAFSLPRRSGDLHLASSSSVVDIPQPQTLEEISEKLALSDGDADILYSTAVVLRLLSNADDSSFADVDRIRRIVEYDQLLDRLSSVRAQVPASKRPVILAAESILLRIVRGPIDMTDLQVMRDTVAQLDLVTSINAMSNASTISHSL